MATLDGTEPITRNEDRLSTDEITARIEHLREERGPGDNFEPLDLEDYIRSGMDEETKEEYDALVELDAEMRSHEDYQYGSIYLVSEDDFENHAQEVADDFTSAETRNSWPFTHVDWEAAANALQQDYSTVEYRGTTYYYR